MPSEREDRVIIVSIMPRRGGTKLCLLARLEMLGSSKDEHWMAALPPKQKKRCDGPYGV